MIEDLGLVEKETGDYDGAVSCLRAARATYKGGGDQLRAALEQADALIEAGKQDEALVLVNGLLRVTHGGPAAVLLHSVADQVIPPSPSPSP